METENVENPSSETNDKVSTMVEEKLSEHEVANSDIALDLQVKQEINAKKQGISEVAPFTHFSSSSCQDSDGSSSELEIDTGDEMAETTSILNGISQVPAFEGSDQQNIHLLAHLASASNPLKVQQDNLTLNGNSNKRRLSDLSDEETKIRKPEMQSEELPRDYTINNLNYLSEDDQLKSVDDSINQIRKQLKVIAKESRQIELRWNELVRTKKAKEEKLLKLRRKKEILLLEKKSHPTLSAYTTENGHADPIMNSLSLYQTISAASTLTQLAGAVVDNSVMVSQGVSGNGSISSLLSNLNIPTKQLPSKQTTKSKSLRDCRRLVDVQTIIAEHKAKYPDSPTQMKGRQRKRWKPAGGLVSSDNNQGVNSITNSAAPLSDSLSYKDMLINLAAKNKIEEPSEKSSEISQQVVKLEGGSELASLLSDPHHNNVPSTSTSHSSFSTLLDALLDTGPDNGSNDSNAHNIETPAVTLHRSPPLTCNRCKTNSAEFVCAGCNKQWYCSRTCQVNDWDDHSDSCSAN